MTLSEFDRLPPFERDLWLADWMEKQKPTCSECGGPLDRCAEPDKAWYPYRLICYVTMATAAAGAKYDGLHEAQQYHDGSFMSWRKERSDSHPYRYNDGVRIGVAESDLVPWDHFTSRVNASPIKSVAEQAPSEETEPTEDSGDGDQEGAKPRDGQDPVAEHAATWVGGTDGSPEDRGERGDDE